MSNLAWSIIAAVLVAVIIILWLRIRRDRQNNFSPKQMVLVRELLQKEVSRVQRTQQDLIDKAASEGKTVSTDSALKYAEELKLRYEAEGRHADAQVVAKMIAEVRESYGREIPIDEAFRLMKKYEGN
jgi:hypothetical protein